MTLATRVILPRSRIWLLEAPAGEWSSGPLVVGEHGLAETKPLVQDGWLLTGPYILDTDAALKAAAEVRDYSKLHALCGICRRPLNDGTPGSTDCGGDCQACIDEIEGR